MKKSLQRVLSLVVALSAVTSSLFGADVTSQTTFIPRSLSEDSAKELALHNYRLYHNMRDERDYAMPEERNIVNLDNTWFYQESTNDKDLAKYFLLGGKDTLQFSDESSTVATANIDVSTSWFDLDTAGNLYQAKMSIRPSRDVYGTVLNWHHDMSKWVKGLWMGILLPVVHVEHDLGLKVTTTFTSSDFNGHQVASLQDGLNHSDMLYGKFSPTSRSATGLDDMQLKLGWNFYRGEKFHFGLYGNVLIPTGSRPSAEYVFEPLVGNVHWGIGAGLNTDMRIVDFKKGTFSFQADAKYRYLFSDVERRSFDLTNGAWTRYLNVARVIGGNTLLTGVVPGINYFTQDMKVTPGSRLEAMAAIHYKYSSWHAELGYNFWWRDREKVVLKDAFDQAIGIPQLTAAGVFQSVTASGSKINNHIVAGNTLSATADAAVTAVADTKFNLGSATHKSAMTHKLFAGVGLTGKLFDTQSMIGFGGEYEFADRNTALEQWSVWLKTGLSF